MHGVAAILFGTDGVFESGTRMRQSKLRSFLRELEERGAAALDENGAQDDRLVIWVKIKPGVDAAGRLAVGN